MSAWYCHGPMMTSTPTMPTPTPTHRLSPRRSTRNTSVAMSAVMIGVVAL